ncbi:MAG TPA: DUF3017 domain-containing protein [Actinophytocola sp.]|uniref:DUF3017 domain-containing protein n=1 Tax=Actinophytocola sp. TaxID=1872138 RepID=UPI002DB74460|nr:DUF3017 domain-containing protein [Actinophytocola sp.]HEU5473927.1 DUF3017 domain-containing protein [Actinophytocola sp.]
MMVLAVVAVGLVRIAQYYWREGAVLVGGALLLAALLRALLPQERIGLVAIRGRGVDVLLYGGLGFAVLAIAMTIQGGPLNQ